MVSFTLAVEREKHLNDSIWIISQHFWNSFWYLGINFYYLCRNVSYLLIFVQPYVCSNEKNFWIGPDDLSGPFQPHLLYDVNETLLLFYVLEGSMTISSILLQMMVMT